MTSLHALITALIRLLGIFFIIRALDNAAAPFFMISAQAAFIPEGSGIQTPNPWLIFLPVVGFYIILALLVFFTAPRVAKIIIPSYANETSETHWHDTLLLCMGIFIMSWSFVRMTDKIYDIISFSIDNDGRYFINNAMIIYLFMSIIVFGSGFLLVAKFHRISNWMTGRRKIANKSK